MEHKLLTTPAPEGKSSKESDASEELKIGYFERQSNKTMFVHQLISFNSSNVDLNNIVDLENFTINTPCQSYVVFIRLTLFKYNLEKHECIDFLINNNYIFTDASKLLYYLYLDTCRQLQNSDNLISDIKKILEYDPTITFETCVFNKSYDALLFLVNYGFKLQTNSSFIYNVHETKIAVNTLSQFYNNKVFKLYLDAGVNPNISNEYDIFKLPSSILEIIIIERLQILSEYNFIVTDGHVEMILSNLNNQTELLIKIFNTLFDLGFKFTDKYYGLFSITSTELLTLFINNSFNIHATNEYNESYLFYLNNKQLDIAKLLITEGVDPNIKNKDNNSCLTSMYYIDIYNFIFFQDLFEYYYWICNDEVLEEHFQKLIKHKFDYTDKMIIIIKDMITKLQTISIDTLEAIYITNELKDFRQLAITKVANYHMTMITYRTKFLQKNNLKDELIHDLQTHNVDPNIINYYLHKQEKIDK